MGENTVASKEYESNYNASWSFWDLNNMLKKRKSIDMGIHIHLTVKSNNRNLPCGSLQCELKFEFNHIWDPSWQYYLWHQLRWQKMPMTPQKYLNLRKDGFTRLSQVVVQCVRHCFGQEWFRRSVTAFRFQGTAFWHPSEFCAWPTFVFTLHHSTYQNH